MNEGYEELCDELCKYGDSKVMKEDKDDIGINIIITISLNMSENSH